MGLKLGSPCGINLAIYTLSNNILIYLLVKFMQDTFSNFYDVDYIKHCVDSFNSHNSCIVSLTTRSRIERTLIENDQITLALL